MSCTVAVCTMDRPADLNRCLTSVLEHCHRYRILVVDQSTSDESARLVEHLGSGGASLDYIRSSRRGLSAARNEALQLATTDLVVFTDDDCEVAPGWITAWESFMSLAPQVGLAFGVVAAPASLALPGTWDGTGHIPTFVPTGSAVAVGSSIFCRGAAAVGIGANMVVRRQICLDVGAFDERLGAGTGLPAAEELDVAIRILRAGYLVGHNSRAQVIHYGFRPARQAAQLNRGYAIATGAMYAKHVRCGDFMSAVWYLLELYRLVSRILVGLSTGRRPLGLNSLRFWMAGFVKSFSIPLDRSQRLYASEPDTDACQVQCRIS